MAEENLQFPVPNSVLEPYIKQAVSAAILSSLGDTDQLIMKVVENAMKQQCNEKGEIDKDRYYNKYPLIETLAKNKIAQITKETILEMAEQMRPKIQEHIISHIKKQQSTIARALVDGLVKSLQTSWSIKVSVDG
jgi:catalase